MLHLVKVLTKGLFVSFASCLIFIGGMYLIGSVRYLSHSVPASMFLFCIPMFFYSISKKITSVKGLFLSNIISSVWIVVPICFLIGWFFATFQFDEFDTNKLFNFSDFIMFSTMVSIPFFVITFITLSISGGIKLAVLKQYKILVPHNQRQRNHKM